MFISPLVNTNDIYPLTVGYLEQSHTVIQALLDLQLVHIRSDNNPIAERLKHFLQNWEKITSDHTILKNIQGVELNFSSIPHQQGSPPNQNMSQEYTSLMTAQIQEMLEKGVIKPVSNCKNQFISNLFLVPKKNGDQRPVINLRQLSQFLVYQHFKMEGLFMVKDFLQKGDHMIKIDLTDAYSVLSIHPKHRKFLRFSWQQTLYEYTCLPFGLAEAPRLYTKILKPVVGLLRRLDVQLIIYLDDILLNSAEKLIMHRDSTLFLLQKLGFKINWEKSMLQPSQTTEFLGFQINSLSMMFFLPEEKINHIKQKCKEMLKLEKVSVRQIAKLTGKLTSSMQAILPANLQSRYLQMLQIKGILIGKSYEQEIILSQEARSERIWWASQIDNHNGKTIITPSPDFVITSDASNLGWGATFQDLKTGGQ